MRVLTLDQNRPLWDRHGAQWIVELYRLATTWMYGADGSVQYGSVKEILRYLKNGYIKAKFRPGDETERFAL